MSTILTANEPVIEAIVLNDSFVIVEATKYNCGVLTVIFDGIEYTKYREVWLENYITGILFINTACPIALTMNAVKAIPGLTIPKGNGGYISLSMCG